MKKKTIFRPKDCTKIQMFCLNLFFGLYFILLIESQPFSRLPFYFSNAKYCKNCQEYLITRRSKTTGQSCLPAKSHIEVSLPSFEYRNSVTQGPGVSACTPHPLP